QNLMVCNSLLATYGESLDMRKSEALFKSMAERNIVSWNIMISGYLISGDLDSCMNVFSTMPMVLAGEVPDETSFLSALLAFKHCGDLDAGWRCFVSASLDFGVLPGNPHYSCVLELLAKSGEMELAKDVAQSLPCDHVAW
ncbi:hypothetical protein SELMODRAFT_71764, partial [Selaginella moellendorffii]